MRTDRYASRLGERRRGLTPQMRLLLYLFASILGIAAGLLYVLPRNERWGNVMVMVFAILTGVLYTRYNRMRKTERKGGNSSESF